MLQAMAISEYEKLSVKSVPKSSCSKSSNLSSCLMKLDYTADESTTSSKNDTSQNKTSPYLRKDRVQMHSRVTERKLVRKKTDFVSSFPLAVNIYKANSDEFKALKRGKKKIKKSVLTLPNDPAPAPQICTVSDMNDSEYFNEIKDARKPKPRKKRTIQNDKKYRKNKIVDVYDRDARYCSQLDIDLDSSSTDFINQFTGDGKKQTRRKVPNNKTEISAHDVWAILKNLNQFQFVPSPPMSQDSKRSAKKKTNIGKIRSNCRDARLIETCRTEEFAYISNFVDNSRSQSSFDRITVIDKQEICQGFEKCVENCKSKFQRPNQKKTKSKTARKQQMKANNCSNIGNNNNNRLQLNRVESNNHCITEKDQKNKITGLRIKSGIQKSKDQQNNLHDVQFCGDFDSSQTNIMTANIFNIDENKYNNKSKTEISGITKVVLSKGNKIENKKTETISKSPDLVSLSVATVMPKLLNKQEIQTPVVSENQPQRLKRGKLTNNSNLKAGNKAEIKTNKLKECSNNALSIENKSNNETKPIFENDVKTEVELEIKQKWQLKDKMLQFLYKKHQGDDGNTQQLRFETKGRKNANRPVEVGTNTDVNVSLLKEANQSKVNVSEIVNASTTSRQTRTTGKWASDFIDSVIKKIRSGVYYNNDKHPYKDNSNKREDSSQTDINIENTFNQMNYPKYIRPQCLMTGEELLKTYPPHNSFKFKREIINSNQLVKETLGSDVMIHNKPYFAHTSKRSKKINFDDIVYNTQINFDVSQEHNSVFKQNGTAVKNLSTVKQSWVEGKWANDFIDNIFKKIKSGVYYTQDEHCICRRYASRIKDNSSQTENFSPNPMNDLDLITDKKLNHESLMLIPGFDNTSNELEIETFSKKQIAVKNCVTNVVVQFDVELLSDPCQALQLKQSFSCIPLAVTESHTTIFKSKTTIINAFLPAELCSILPMMMRRIIASNTKFSLPKLTIGKVESNLSTISELTRCETPELTKQISYEISEPRTSEMLLNIKSVKLFDSIVKPMLELKRNEPELFKINNSIINHKERCVALQIYQPLNKIIQAYKPFNLEYYIENLINTKCLNLILKMPLTVHYFKIRCFNNSIGISVGFENELSNINVNLILSNVSIDSLSNNFKKSIECGQNIASTSNNQQNGSKDMDKHTAKLTTTIVTEKRRSGSEFRLSNSKNKKKRFARLYKKCNSMSNLSNNKSTVSIDKITNTAEFVQALGSSKVLAAVIDGNTERKILLSLKEMKNWMTDITPRQALLVLLLANKSDTPNVMRYRPVVLQGIALNRITRVSELDMEIEVITRENLNRIKQFEGISYLPASVENQDTLLEELYWIAKTTASDYQKPFDESSERLLKSLLEKRKKLNPSYLRVMARYVGLGLLKSSK